VLETAVPNNLVKILFVVYLQDMQISSKRTKGHLSLGQSVWSDDSPD